MSNTMSHGHEPISYLDSVLSEEERRTSCEYSHQWRNFTISRSGRFKSKNKKRDIVDGKLFDAQAGGQHSGGGGAATSATTAASAAAAATTSTTTVTHTRDDRAYRIGGGTASTGNYWELDKNKAHRQQQSYYHQHPHQASASTVQHSATTTRGVRDKPASYKSYYETNL